ncbi:MAG: hypothetical protein WC956_08995 [bacterium]
MVASTAIQSSQAAQAAQADAMGIGLASPGNPITSNSSEADKAKNPTAGSRQLGVLQIPPQPLPSMMQVAPLAPPYFTGAAAQPAGGQNQGQAGNAGGTESKNGGTTIKSGSGKDKEEAANIIDKRLGNKVKPGDIPDEVARKLVKGDMTAEEALAEIRKADKGQPNEPVRPPAANPPVANTPQQPAVQQPAAPANDPAAAWAKYSGLPNEEAVGLKKPQN